MIDDAPLITLKNNPPRPTADQLAALQGVPSGFVVDALGGGGAVAHDIKPVVAGQDQFCGVAVTVDAGPADNLAVLAALKVTGRDDVIVATAGGFRETAIVGDLVLHMARNRGAVGFVTDGCVRDTPGIRDVGLPCFAVGVSPNSPAKNGPGTVNMPIVLGGQRVSAGDIVVADVDGAVIVPFARIDEVIARLADINAAEADMMARVGGGMGVTPYIEDLYAAGRVKQID